MKCDLEDPCGNCRKVAKECVPAVRHTKPRSVPYTTCSVVTDAPGLRTTRLNSCKAKSTSLKISCGLSLEAKQRALPRHSVHGGRPAQRMHMPAVVVGDRTPTCPLMSRLVKKAMMILVQLSTLLLVTNIFTIQLGMSVIMIQR
jgi:hypothetical protein